MGKRNLQKSTNPKKKKDKFTEIETFIRKITVPNNNLNQVIRELINAANQGKYSYTGKVANELYERLTRKRIDSQTGIVKEALGGRLVENINKGEGEYELSWENAFKPREQIDLTCFSPDLSDEELIESIHNNLPKFLYLSTYKAKKDQAREDAKNVNDSDECR